MGRPKREVEQPALSGPSPEWACNELPRMLFASDSPVAADIHGSLCSVGGAAADDRLERMLLVLDGHGLRDAGERFLARQWSRQRHWRDRQGLARVHARPVPDPRAPRVDPVAALTPGGFEVHPHPIREAGKS